MRARAARLPAYALFAALLAAAGLPIYIHAPKFYVDEYGVSLTALGSVLFGLRLLDVVQDPALGWLAQALRHKRGLAVTGAGAVMALAMLGLFAVPAPMAPVLWFALMLTLVFSAFSFLTICFYAQGVAKADSLPGAGHLTLARWRETGALLGVCLASVAPLLLGLALDRPFAGFAVGFAVLALWAVVAMRKEWRAAELPGASGFGTVLRDGLARRLLLIALVNAAPVAVTSTLFLFYVELALEAPGWEGPLLLLFFIAAAAAAPLWGMLAERHGPRRVLLAAMALGIAAFGGALFLGPGDVVLFALVCLASGAVLGADLTLLPAMFASRMAQISPSAAEGFGLWSFVSKLTLAFAAAALLPALEGAGLQTATGTSSDTSISLLIWFYAGVPCALKLLAIALLAGAKDVETS
ncbi:sugar:cation symporter [Sulfitobacter sp. KE29]|uniref:MFS transporter n=1 Tax=unclassified Sulfitobacter TaxID=196795 RepID=UPI0007C2AB57|nr:MULTISPECIES: MFS transporter [unclassified Sulfitobacter]KZY49558.1 sugar:cation symporter [Sulfitobacter sp. HI0054]MBO9438432.1 MFS transporter [Sulfitobacter sp. R18_2]MDF3417801.1 sugar:cation symporter [Sulfitobacter sp. Ks38]MDF3425283.1 sugar:cation symporter [Sulfitobacter sp. KE29]MDF3428864.1 sugar:cation symporter [Sulfitobacter sp. S46]